MVRMQLQVDHIVYIPGSNTVDVLEINLNEIFEYTRCLFGLFK